MFGMAVQLVYQSTNTRLVTCNSNKGLFSVLLVYTHKINKVAADKYVHMVKNLACDRPGDVTPPTPAGPDDP